MTDLYAGDLDAIRAAMTMANTFAEQFAGSHNVEIRIGDSNGDTLGTVKFNGTQYLFEPWT